MSRRIIDLTLPLKTGHFRWTVERKKLRSHAAGNIAEVSWIGFPVHGFTHIDAPRHFSADGTTTDDLSLDAVMGTAAIVDVSGGGASAPITEDMVERAGGHVGEGDIVLLRAGWDHAASIDTPEFWTQAPYMTIGACRWLRARSIKAIGYDFPQDYCIRDYVSGAREPTLDENTTHVELLLKGVPMMEYLCNLTEIRSDRTEFMALPLKIPDCDGAPIRAIAIEDV